MIRGEVINLGPWLKQLSKLSDEMAGEVLVTALQAGGLPIMVRWKEIAPYETGTYRRSIHIEVIEAKKNKAAIAIGTDITDPPYPLFLEFGTFRMPPHPSGRPAWDAKIDEAKREVVAVLNQQLEKAAR